MKVYVLIEQIPYEGEELLGVYATEELAEHALTEAAKFSSYSALTIVEKEVQS